MTFAKPSIRAASVLSFQIPGSSGEVIRVRVHLPKDPRSSDAPPVAILCHGFKGFKDWGFFPNLAQHIGAAGIAAVRFDFSHNGVGEDTSTFERLDLFERNTWSRELDDLTAVIDWLFENDRPEPLRAIDTQRLALLGHSRGGGMALLQAANDKRSRAVATLAAISTTDRLGDMEKAVLKRDGRLMIVNARTKQEMPFGQCQEDDRLANAERLDIRAAASKLNVPALLVHGTADESVPLGEGEALKNANPDAQILWIEGATHTFGCVHPFQGDTPHWAIARSALVEFLQNTLLSHKQS